MAHRARRYSFGPDILALRLTNWARIVNTKTVVDFRRLHQDDLERQIAALDTQVRPPTHVHPTTATDLAARLRTAWGASRRTA